MDVCIQFQTVVVPTLRYKQQAEGDAAKAAAKDDVVDAEFEEVDKRDRKAG